MEYWNRPPGGPPTLSRDCQSALRRAILVFPLKNLICHPASAEGAGCSTPSSSDDPDSSAATTRCYSSRKGSSGKSKMTRTRISSRGVLVRISSDQGPTGGGNAAIATATKHANSPAVRLGIGGVTATAGNATSISDAHLGRPHILAGHYQQSVRFLCCGRRIAAVRADAAAAGGADNGRRHVAPAGTHLGRSDDTRFGAGVGPRGHLRPEQPALGPSTGAAFLEGIRPPSRRSRKRILYHLTDLCAAPAGRLWQQEFG